MFYKYKKEIILITFLFLCFLVLPQTSQAATYYLDAVNGLDTNPGTESQPWKTINRASWSTKYAGAGANPLVAAGDTVILRTGEYGQWKWTDVSEPNSWITYQADKGATPHFWYIMLGASLGVQKNMYVIIDGMNITWTGKTGPEIYLVQLEGINYVKLKNSYLEGLVHPDTGRGIRIGGISYSQLAKYIEIDNCEITSSGTGITGSYVGDPNGAAENGLIVKNCNIHNLYDDAISFSAISNSTFQDNEIHNLSVLGNTKHIDGNDTISGMLTVGETVTQGTASGVVIAQLTSKGHQYIFIKGDDYTAWSVGVEVTGQSSGVTYTPTVRETTSHADAIQLFAPIPRIQTLDDIIIRRNKIWDTRGQGIFLMQQKNMLIENNLIYGEFLASAIKIHNDSISGTVRNNTVCKTYSTQADISFESNISPWTTGQSYRQGYNVLYDSLPYRSLLIHTPDSDNKPPNATYWKTIDTITFNVYNNLTCRSMLFSNEFGQVLNEGYNITGIFSMYNNPGPSNTDYQYGHYPLTVAEIDALFVNPDNNDYHLKANSWAINFGNPDYGPTTDILGNPRDSQPDAGAYEYISSTPPPPSILYGDVNGDGAISSADALLAAQHSLGLTTLTSSQIQKGDVSGDGKVSAYDAALILQKVAGIISKFPKE